MLRSMYSGISGMKVNQTRLDVIGNNIANVNTTGYKSSRARFSETLSQNVSEASAPTINAGGKNASQVGLGVQLASIDRIMTQGNMQATSRSLDVAVDGNGYFMVSSSGSVYADNGIAVNHAAGTHNVTNAGASMMYTRDGAFYVDSAGNLCCGEGYKVLGYSLTNDDSTQKATALSPDTVSAGGFDFNFGAGSQLNGYSIVLGKISSGTTTSCTVDKNNKQIILDGDFSTTTNLNADQVAEAINTGLNNAGISQSIRVSGKVQTIANTSADKISGGQDAASPDKLSFAGFTFAFSEGSALNGYTFEIKEVSAEKTSASIVQEGNAKKIILNGNFIEGIDKGEMEVAINKALQDAKIPQTVTVNGSSTVLSALSSTSGTATIGKAPDFKVEGTKTKNTLGGKFKLSLDTANDNYGAAINGYSIKTIEDIGANDLSVTIKNSAITITGDIKNASAADIKDAINTALANKDINIKFNVEEIPGGTYEADDVAKLDNEGLNYAAVTPMKLGYNNSFTFTFPDPLTLKKAGLDETKLDGIKFVIKDVQPDDGKLKATPDPKDPKQINIVGNFKEAGAVSAEELQREINSALGLSGDTEVKVTGSSKVYSSLVSDEAISNGSEFASPTGKYEMLGFTFTPTEGSTLNGYTIQAGSVAAGTKTAVDVDTKNKTITISGDFVNGTITKEDLTTRLSSALNKAGLGAQGIRVDGAAQKVQANVTESYEIAGGTPLQSLDEAGNVNFVNAKSTVYSYDTGLKTLKIPEAVVKDGRECKVKSYSISADGIITAALDDGSSAALGQIAMADFANTEGLVSLGGNMYQDSANSGTATIRSGVNTNGEDNSGGFGNQMQGYLEMSNVDLSEQFTDMITATRAFQASSKMISTGDDILQEIINLKR